ncbi:MAG: anaerobic ribonucleoside-triphosphate reductase, partial [bacterium]
ALQEFVFNMNVPTRVGFQTPFTNLTMDLNPSPAIINEPAIIGGELMDKTLGEFQKEMDMINKAFAEVMMEGDAKGRVFSFPIPTYNITEDFDWDNTKYDKIWEMTAKYGIPYFSNFINSDMKPEQTRSMCPLGGDELVLVKTSKDNIRYSKIKDVFYSNQQKSDVKIYSDGRFVEGKFHRYKNQEMMSVELCNGHSVEMSKSHLNFVMKNPDSDILELEGNDIKEGYYLPYSLNVFKGEGGTYDLGYIVGAFAGDGSYDPPYGSVFSLNNSTKLGVIKKLENILKRDFGANYSVTEGKNNVVKLSTWSPHVSETIRYFIKGNKAVNKYFKPIVFEMSEEFRRGVLDGYLHTDGGNRNRIYTSSERMVKCLNMLTSTLGTTTSIYIDDRTREDGKLSDKPNYVVLVYKLNRNNYDDLWFKKENKLWMKVKSVKDLNKKITAYCFTVKNDEPIFTIGTSGILTHNCRLRLDKRELEKRGGGLFGANPMTGSIGVVTLNMPRIGYQAKDKKDFLNKTFYLMDKAKESLEIKRKILEKLTDINLYPYAKFYLRDIKKRFDNYWQNHFNTIGLNGMNEAVLNFMGEDIGSKVGIEFTKEIMSAMRDKLVEYQEETGHMYNLEATPAEGTSYRLAKIDYEKFNGRIVSANDDRVIEEGADPYYTNSSQLPVGYTDDIFTALELQDDIQTLYTGGTVFHGFLGENMPSIGSTKKLVRKIAENFKLPYYTITPTFSVCPIHGYLSGEHEYCPKCDEERGIK